MTREFFELDGDLFPLDTIESLKKYRNPSDGRFGYALHLYYKDSGMKHTIEMPEEKGERLKQSLLKGE